LDAIRAAPDDDVAALLRDPATSTALHSVQRRCATADRPVIEQIAIEARSAVRTADATLTEGWQRRPHPRIKLDLPLDWENACAGDRTWAYRLHAWEPLSEPLTAYSETGEARFLTWSLDLALDWVRQHPRYDPNSPFAWYDMAVGMRAFRLAYLVAAGVQAGLLEPDTTAQLLASLRLHLRVLSLEENFSAHSNHGIYQAAGQLAASTRIPDLPESAAAAEQATGRLRELVSHHFDEEGVHREHSPGYNLMVLRSLLRLRSSGLIHDWNVLGTLDRAEETIAWFIAPVGGVPLVGDTDRLRRNVVDDPHFDHPHARYAVTQGRDGEAPRSNFRAFAGAGYVAARDRWASGAEFERSSYLLQACGFHSRVHKHADDLSFVWYARGTDLLADAGRFGYYGRDDIDPALRELGFNYSDPRRIYVESTRAHNCLEIDGTSYPRRRAKAYGSALQSARLDPTSGLVITEAKVTHPPGVQHTRYLCHLPGAWTLVVDYAAGSPESRHAFVQRFHFGPDLEELVQGDGCFRLPIPNAGEHLVATQFAAARALEPCRGQTEPDLLGFNARYPATLLPNWTIAWEQSDCRSASFAALFVIVPEQAEFHARGRLNATGRAGQVSWDAGRAHHDLRWDWLDGGRHDYVCADAQRES
jgi:hypothetical protein